MLEWLGCTSCCLYLSLGGPFLARAHGQLHESMTSSMLGPTVQEEAAYKLCKVKQHSYGKGAVPYLVTHDGRTIRYPDPDIKVLHGHESLCMLPCAWRLLLCWVLLDAAQACGMPGRCRQLITHACASGPPIALED